MSWSQIVNPVMLCKCEKQNECQSMVAISSIGLCILVVGIAASYIIVPVLIRELVNLCKCK